MTPRIAPSPVPLALPPGLERIAGLHFMPILPNADPVLYFAAWAQPPSEALLAYIGVTDDLHARYASHKRKLKQTYGARMPELWFWRPVPAAVAHAAEGGLIKLLRPTLNRPTISHLTPMHRAAMEAAGYTF